MIIECPACQARAQLPDSKEGAKVRCSECGRVYVAQTVGARGARRKQDKTTQYILIGGVVVVLLLLGLFVANRGGDPPPPPPEEEPEVVDAGPSLEELMGWEGPTVKAVRDLHDRAAALDDGSVSARLGTRELHAWVEEQRRLAAEAAEEEYVPGKAWDAMDAGQRNLFVADVAKDLVHGSGKELVGDWKPFLGSTVELEDERAVVRVQVQHRDPSLGLPDRWVEWHLVQERGAWRAVSWERWISPDEVERERRARTKKTEKVTLSDGSVVIQGVIRDIPYDDDVPGELRTRIDDLIARLVDPAATKTFTIQQELAEIGKPAIAPLLTQLNQIPLDSEANAIRLNLVNMVLQDITGEVNLYKPSELLGTTPERQEAGLRQWFGWYDRKYKRFQGRTETEDPLLDDPDFKPRTEKERLEFEKARGGG